MSSSPSFGCGLLTWKRKFDISSNHFEDQQHYYTTRDNRTVQQQRNLVTTMTLTQTQPKVVSKLPNKIPQDDPESVYGKRYRIFYPAYVKKSDCSPIPESDSWYKMTSFPRGKLLIVNIRYFHPSTGLDKFPRERSGTDVETLVNLFLRFGYIVEVYEDLSKAELLWTMTKASKTSYNNYNSFVCALLTHGEEQTIYAVDGGIEMRQITKMFSTPKLRGLPKIFLVQACRSSSTAKISQKMDALITSPEGSHTEKQEESDFLIIYSTLKGYDLWKNSKGGSWFIQALCFIFREKARDTDIVQMLKKVNELVVRPKNGGEAIESGEQVASVLNYLKKEFYFFPPLLT